MPTWSVALLCLPYFPLLILYSLFPSSLYLFSHPPSSKNSSDGGLTSWIWPTFFALIPERPFVVIILKVLKQHEGFRKGEISLPWLPLVICASLLCCPPFPHRYSMSSRFESVTMSWGYININPVLQREKTTWDEVTEMLMIAGWQTVLSLFFPTVTLHLLDG